MTSAAPQLTLLVLRAADPQALADFYTRHLGLTFTVEQHGQGPLHLVTSLGDTVLELYPRGTQPATTGVRLGLAVVNLTTTWQGWPEALQERHKDHTAVVRDPEGHAWYLTERPGDGTAAVPADAKSQRIRETPSPEAPPALEPSAVFSAAQLASVAAELEAQYHGGAPKLLRSVYLSPEMDDVLRMQAFDSQCSKQDLIVHYLAIGMAPEILRRRQAAAQRTADVFDAAMGEPSRSADGDAVGRVERTRL